MTETFDPRTVAARLHGLREAGRQEATDSFPLPGDFHQAMEAQNLLAATDGIASNAWKVTVSPQGQAVTAPLHPYAEAVSGADIPWYPGLKFETEIAVRLGRDLPVRTGVPYSRANVVEAISAVHLGAELLVSAVRESGSVSFLLFVADRLGNSGYVLGPKLEKSVVDTVGGTPLKVTHAGRTIYDGPAQHPKGDVLTWLVDYANDGLRPETSLKTGALITTGTLSGAIELTEPGEIDIELGNSRLSFSVSKG
ncbi:2-keto-4-pentenoate hydratase (plasmid) [Rhizobium leguminosarum]|jgi:2-keto-4-pentenoate hydratase|uniref:2-keto-4-pentenoate hydratase n=2 Tax=Rhizobium leguminosarum TaxID=384 RepID=A0A1B8R6G4_RHILT|nr:fumarylacetoacetate hydrolase family protein [Rhizobium leguminosarum]AOO92853.1 2-keto-4-pentenoate hydratase [Rhizobium leguminosarum bv. trifolii]AXA44868.1 Fumarylacetoacetate (FAA) hydrolase family protein [Rhizobium leguminosarum]MBA8833406.1 2-keto-4-pentenoate hydratase [Rhizobium leguminosarum]MDH6274318.1 2-keto-4-pentenoate hydratase [Rhizobium leguminosarum]MVO93605.1 2-keto-4-pentenoate hydratase [Rhizobium leguminosarum bv. phaseoli]